MESKKNGRDGKWGKDIRMDVQSMSLWVYGRYIWIFSQLIFSVNPINIEIARTKIPGQSKYNNLCIIKMEFPQVRKCVAGVSILLGDMFRKHGIPVHYSTIDCDDTIAAFAYHSGGSVLSRDCDFFRYYATRYTGSPPFQVS